MDISIITNKLPSWLATREPTLQDLIKSGTAEQLKTLVVKDDLSVNEELPNGELPLHFAIYQNKPEIVITLLEMSADPELRNSENLSAIDVAVLMKNDELLAVILARKLGEDFRQIELQIKNKGSESHVAELQARLSNITKVDRNQTSELVEAIISGNIQEVRYRLTDSNKNALDAQGFAPIHYAVLAGKMEMIDLLLQKGVNIDLQSREGDTPLHMAALQKSVSRISKLIEKGAKPNSQNIHGQTPLHYACAKEDFAAVTALVQSKANVQLLDNEGMSPLALMGATAYTRDPLALSLSEQFLAATATLATACMAALQMGYAPWGVATVLPVAMFLNTNLEIHNGIQSTKSALGKMLATMFLMLPGARQYVPGASLLCQGWATHHVAKTSFENLKKSSKYLGYRNGAVLRNILVYGTNTAFSLFKMATHVQDLLKFLTTELNPKYPEDACKILSADCTLDAARAGGEKYVNNLFREASKKAHPDRPGGNGKDFVRLSEAKDTLLNYLNSKKA